jgi:hypothetical protein
MKYFPIRSSVISLSLSLAVWTCGCGQTTDKGGPGANPGGMDNASTDDDTSGNLENGDDTFTLTLPGTETEITAGGEETVTIDVNRGDEFHQEVSISLDVPEGLSVDPASPQASAETDEVSIVVKAAPDAAPGRHTINVTGKPTAGDTATGSFVVVVSSSQE